MTSPVTTTFEAEQTTNNTGLMWKAIGGILYSTPRTVAIPTAFTDGSNANLIQLSTTDWTRLGLISKSDGVTFSRDTSSEDTESWGYSQPTRTDIVSETSSAQFNLQETKRATLELYNSVDLSAVTPNATTGEVAYNKPSTPITIFRRLIFMAVDGAGADRRYRWKIMPNAQVSAVDDEAWNASNTTVYPVTIQAKPDPVLGYAVREVFGGPGQKARNVAAGWSTT